MTLRLIPHTESVSRMAKDTNKINVKAEDKRKDYQNIDNSNKASHEEINLDSNIGSSSKFTPKRKQVANQP